MPQNCRVDGVGPGIHKQPVQIGVLDQLLDSLDGLFHLGDCIGATWQCWSLEWILESARRVGLVTYTGELFVLWASVTRRCSCSRHGQGAGDEPNGKRHDSDPSFCCLAVLLRGPLLSVVWFTGLWKGCPKRQTRKAEMINIKQADHTRTRGQLYLASVEPLQVVNPSFQARPSILRRILSSSHIMLPFRASHSSAHAVPICSSRATAMAPGRAFGHHTSRPRHHPTRGSCRWGSARGRTKVLLGCLARGRLSATMKPSAPASGAPVGVGSGALSVAEWPIRYLQKVIITSASSP